MLRFNFQELSFTVILSFMAVGQKTNVLNFTTRIEPPFEKETFEKHNNLEKSI